MGENFEIDTALRRIVIGEYAVTEFTWDATDFKFDQIGGQLTCTDYKIHFFNPYLGSGESIVDNLTGSMVYPLIDGNTTYTYPINEVGDYHLEVSRNDENGECGDADLICDYDTRKSLADIYNDGAYVVKMVPHQIIPGNYTGFMSDPGSIDLTISLDIVYID